MTFEIYWDDLNPTAQGRLKNLYHENINLSPIAIIEVEDKVFMWKDKSGRGFANEISLTAITEDATNIDAHEEYLMELEENDHTDDSLIEWATNAEIGDEFAIDMSYYIRIS